MNWEIAGHFGARPRLRRQVRPERCARLRPGHLGPSLAYRPSNRTFYWLGQIDSARTYIYTATAVEGP
ncbi:hypothetical protein LT493_23455 [Streptomyces tricolor]|nr:hypothetical protein [Streptomyces tricolor]